MKPPVPESTSPAGLTGAASGAKAGEEPHLRAAPETQPAPGGFPTTRAASKPTADGPRTAAAEAKAGEGLTSATAPETRPAPHGHPAGTETTPMVSVPSFPSARLLLPADASEDEWHAARLTGIGGSDVAAILGMDRYRGPLHVWRAKRGELDQQRDIRLERSALRRVPAVDTKRLAADHPETYRKYRARVLRVPSEG